ncbi:hypothetical protein RBH29_10875 [Herbivorax sp. ANBcel31]|uniref:hypothetical protein n=1 Tax=Herbivorax sp. ANBcel31 TaxID=3069754 RepID=UPI0027B17BDC|nr:hypothetical protein [Herbivorax sp. ANBcel31]MDQ2086930.1 hypothetical protein [Herbivorax sp. ANBcel31]
MKKLLYLINFEIGMQIKKILIITAVMFLVQSIAIMLVSSVDKNSYLRFEELLSMSGIPIMFVLALGVILVFSAFSFYRDFVDGKSIYALLTLPQKREYIFYSKTASSVISVFMLWAAQFGSIFICYGIYNASTYGVPKVHNALLLAFTRSDFLRVLFPLDTLYFVITALILLTFVIFAVFVAIAERSKKYKYMFVPLPWVLGMLMFSVFPLYSYRYNILFVFAAIILLDFVLVKLAIKLVKTQQLG